VREPRGGDGGYLKIDWAVFQKKAGGIDG